MSKPEGANNGVNGVPTPSDSPTENPSDTPNVTPETPETPLNTETPAPEVPFHQRPELRETIDYIGRQVLKAVEERLGSPAPRAPQETTAITSSVKAEIEARADAFAKKHNVDKQVAMDMMMENRQLLEGDFNALNRKVESFDLVFKFNALFNQVPDAKNYSREMAGMLENMNPTERTFILNSPNGTEFLYFKAKQSKPNVPARAPAPTTTPRSPNPAMKMGTTDVKVNAAISAFKNKDPKAFQDAVQSINK